jgi:hypothetical protein
VGSGEYTTERKEERKEEMVTMERERNMYEHKCMSTLTLTLQP